VTDNRRHLHNGKPAKSRYRLHPNAKEANSLAYVAGLAEGQQIATDVAQRNHPIRAQKSHFSIAWADPRPRHTPSKTTPKQQLNSTYGATSTLRDSALHGGNPQGDATTEAFFY
jgi:hypothetical protein